jgi:hypothetical protein
MEKKYVIKCFTEQTYYCGEDYGWSIEARFADYFDTFEHAENFIKREDGQFQIEIVYVVSQKIKQK